MADLWSGERGCSWNDLPPLVPKFPSRGNFGDDGHVALGNELGFPKFSKIKHLGGDSVSGKAVHVWHFFLKISFSKNNLPDLDSLMIHRSCIALCEIRYKTMTSTPNCSKPQMNKTRFPPGTFGDVYSFWRLRWGFRGLDSNLWYLVLTTLMCFFALHVH